MNKLGEIIISMIAVCALTGAQAKTLTMTEFGRPVFADAEVSTNIAFSVDRTIVTEVHFRIECETSVTNGTEISVGHDVNGDGALSPEESGLTFGCDAGTWFTRETDSCKGLESETQCCLTNREFVMKIRDIPETWNLMRVTHRGFGGRNDHAVVFDRRAFQFFIR